MRCRTLSLLFVLLCAGCSDAGRGAAAKPKAIPERAFTFAVLGDNRGDYDGRVPAVFEKIVQELSESRPELVINTGDMICGRTDEPGLRIQWDNYRRAIAPLAMPLYHVPGNHDVEDDPTGRLWREFWGERYYSFEHAGCRFIILDCETTLCRIPQAQYRWLEEALASAGNRPVFVFLHRPLFPFGIYKGGCMDAYPEERDRLHRLFVSHRDSIHAVFVGHEHLYHAEERDGIRYYTTGGAGAWPYAAPEQGGFHHYLLVRMSDEGMSVDLRKVDRPPETKPAPDGEAAPDQPF